ncbi:MAG TPA: class I SAM-dependent methyltransferase [Gammaproteobacteria bacterium]|nr:class I SAM-dependent methyltransferase [Gammaproteobacteria bacterium]
MLSEIFAKAIERHRPRSVAVLGCAGGNGLERISAASAMRIVCVDINPDYIALTRARFADSLRGLELVVLDVEAEDLAFGAVDLIFAALLFEYVDARRVLSKIPSILNPTGVLVSVLQLPHPCIGKVSPSPFTSLAALAPSLRLLSPARLIEIGGEFGLAAARAEIAAASGKQFRIQDLRRPSCALQRSVARL